MKRGLTLIIIFIMMLTGCKSNDVMISRFSYRSEDTEIWGTKVDHISTVVVYYEDEIVSTMEMIDEVVFPIGETELIEKYSELISSGCSGGVFLIEGISHSSRIEENVYTSTILLEYNEMDMEKLIESENWFVKAEKIVNENLKVDYHKLETKILEDGYKPID